MAELKVTDKRVERLGERIRELRKERGLSQEGLANLTNIDRGYMGTIERGERNITLKKLFDICDALNVQPSEVFDNFDMTS